MNKTAAVLICALVLIFLPFGSYGAFAFEQTTLKDIDEHWAQSSIETLNELGVMNGYEGFSNPDSIITRGEFTALITRAFGMKSAGGSKEFADIKKDHIFYDAVMAASTAGIIDGFEDGTFRPDNMITREEIMLIVSRLSYGYASKAATFKDISADYIYLPQLYKICEDGIIGGYPDGTFKPYNRTTRAEAATIVIKAAKKYIEPGNTDELYQFGYTYINDHFSNPAAAEAKATGSALSDLSYIQNTYDTANKLGYTLSNSVSQINIVSFNQYGPFAEFSLEYTITRTMGQNVKTYKGQSDLGIITRGGISKVYRHYTRIVVPEFINLTWEVFSSAPSYNTPGVNYVSPTSFRIETKADKPLGQMNIDSNTLYFNSDLKAEYLDYAASNGYKVWAMYKTDFLTSTASMFLNSNEARKHASDILACQILRHNLDGINFDFENMYKADKGAYTNHVKEISLMAHTLGVVVSVDITKYEKTSSTWSMCYDRDALAKYADYIMLMAYDQYYAGGKTPGPVSGLGWTEDCIRLTLKEVPSEKLVLGIPYYVRIWETKNGKSLGTKAVSMSEALRQIEENNAAIKYDSKFGLNKYYWNKGDKTYMLWLDDANSTKQRVALAKRYSLAGIASWRRGFETKDVWTAIADEIKK